MGRMSDMPSVESPPEGALVRARTSFLVDDRVDDGSVRDIILASWTRSREWNIDVDGAELSAFDTESDSLLVRAARPVLDSVTDELAGEPVSVILTDAEGVVLERRTGDSSLSQALDRIWLAPGFSYSEKFVGTNGIGTALEGRGPAEVFGHEHYVEPLAQFACAGAPVWHPVSGKLLGVIDLTCWRQDAGRFMSTAVARIARQIETALMDQSGPRELALLHDYLTACRRSNMAVFAVSPDLVMSNDRARELIDPADQARLIAGAIEAMNSERRVLLLDLPSGVVARVQVRPSWVDRGAAGGVLQVQLAAPEVPKPRAVSPAPVTALPGRGRQRPAVGEVLPGRRPALPQPRVARAAGRGGHRQDHDRARHPPAPHPGGAPADPQRRGLRARLGRRRRRGARHRLRHPRAHPPRPAVRPGSPGARRRAWSPTASPPSTIGPGWSPRSGPGGLGRPDDPVDLLEFFPRTVVVPPLRHHVEDVAELVPHFIARLTRGAELSCSPEAMRLLMRNRWPGNIEQLYQVLRKTVARRRAGVLAPDDLPPEVRAITRRVLTPLEAIECDAIVDALLDNNGNKAEAARHLGMSRATIYRKIRGYGISTPTTG